MTTYKQIPSWSFSNLMDYEACPHRAWHKSINKSPRPPYEENRGTNLHTRIENFFSGTHDAFPDISPYARDEIYSYRELSRLPHYTYNIELQYSIGIDWEHCDPKNAWGKAIVDLEYECENNPDHLSIVDWKSGKIEGNEVKHIMQGQLYSLVACTTRPNLNAITVEFLYLDEGRTRRNLYKRDQILKWQPKWHERAKTMTGALTFPPKANKANCRFCMFGPQGSDVCEYGIPSP
jgi:CRISPR/Cas system-associated exonuclease Cas4 (RecB family)